MHNLIQAVLHSDDKTDLQQLINTLSSSPKWYYLRTEILQAFGDYCHQSQKPAYFYHSSSLGKLIHFTHELILENDSIWLLLRPWVGGQQIWRLAADLSQAERRTPEALLEVSDRQINRHQANILEIDLGPFYKGSATISDPRNIGQGLAFLNHHLCHQMLSNPQYWLEALFEVLHRHQHDGTALLINEKIHSGTQLSHRVKQAIRALGKYPGDEPYANLDADMQALGFAPGWGNTASRALETLELLERLLDNPEPPILEAFVARIPAIFRIVLVSIHGWVGQESVLGRSETLGQVAYVLDQARSLETRLLEDIQLSGLDFLGIQPQVVILTRLIPNCEGTQCDLKLEKVNYTENCWILRVPFQEFNPKVTQNWITKFEIWPYLESFALNAEKEILARLGGRPNLIIGNYSDGNLVAFLLARRLKTLQGNIAHSLEKPKYLFSNLYWQELESQYHFSAQFTADLISMNAADFVITSSYQEIIGTPETMGQYESYKSFTMPQLYHVVDGIDLFSPKFNRIPPGVSEHFFFPYTQTADRGDRAEVEHLLFNHADNHTIGQIDDLNKSPMLAVAPMSSIKNLTGLVECFGKSEALQARSNLILVTNKLYLSEAINAEEAGEIEKLHQIINQYNLHGQVRWVGKRLPSETLGEVYRVIADHQGIFVHFARFEAFGRVILEAMISGLPTFATQYGGALEIIEDGRSGFLIDPTDFERTAEKIVKFIDQSQASSEYWQEISTQAIERVRNEYNWQLHTKQLLLLAKIYTFWNYVYQDSREALLRYLEALFYLVYKPRAETILEQHQQR